MARRDTTPVKDRLRFVWLWMAGKSFRAISRETGRGANTVSKWIRRWVQEGHVQIRRNIRYNPFKTQRPSAFHQLSYALNPGAPCLPLHTSMVKYDPAYNHMFRCWQHLQSKDKYTYDIQ